MGSFPGLLCKLALVVKGVPPEGDTMVLCELGILKDRGGEVTDPEEVIEESGPKVTPSDLHWPLCASFDQDYTLYLEFQKKKLAFFPKFFLPSRQNIAIFIDSVSSYPKNTLCTLT